MCPLILSYPVFNSARYQIIHVHGETKPTLSKPLGQVSCMIELRKGPAAWFPTGTRMVMF